MHPHFTVVSSGKSPLAGCIGVSEQKLAQSRASRFDGGQTPQAVATLTLWVDLGACMSRAHKLTDPRLRGPLSTRGAGREGVRVVAKRQPDLRHSADGHRGSSPRVLTCRTESRASSDLSTSGYLKVWFYSRSSSAVEHVHDV